MLGGGGNIVGHTLAERYAAYAVVAALGRYRLVGQHSRVRCVGRAYLSFFLLDNKVIALCQVRRCTCHIADVVGAGKRLCVVERIVAEQTVLFARKVTMGVVCYFPLCQRTAPYTHLIDAHTLRPVQEIPFAVGDCRGF